MSHIGLSKLEERELARLASGRSVQNLLQDASLIEAHYRKLAEARGHNEFLDLQLARSVADLLVALIGDAERFGPEQCALLNGAIQYFVLVDDHDDDVASSIGLEDDARVANAVAQALGRPDLLIEF